MSDLPSVFIYCDDASHGGRRIAVRTFVRFVSQSWSEMLTPHDRHRHAETATALVGNTPALEVGGEPMRRSGALDWGEPGETYAVATGLTREQLAAKRVRYRLVCRKCPDTPLQVRGEKLDAVLDAVAAAGVAEVSMNLLRGSLRLLGEQPGA